MRAAFRLVVCAASAALVAAGCGGDGSSVADGRHFGYWITVCDGEVVAIDEQYLP